MIKDNSKQFSFQFILILLLFLMITIMSLMIILMGKDIYSSINNDRAINYEKRVSLSYVANKIRQSDRENSIEVRSLGDSKAVVIKDLYDDQVYETWIYHFDNAIYEMFTDEGVEFTPDDGMKVMEIESFNIEEMRPDLYKFTASSNNESTELIISIYSN
jgi:hypothetical protein